MKKALLLLPPLLLAGLAWWFSGKPAEVVPVTGGGPAAPAGDGSVVEPPAVEPSTAEAVRAAERAEIAPAPAPDPALVGREPSEDRRAVAVVIDGDGRRLGGARVHWKRGTESGEVVADDDGLARLPLPTPGPPIQLWAESEGHATTHVTASGSGPFVLSLVASTSLSGRVLDADSRAPLAGVRLHVRHGSCRGCERDVATSGPDGSYAFPEIPLGVDLRIRAEGNAVPAQQHDLRLSSGSEAQVHDFLLDRGVLIRGTVVDFTTGAPVADAEVAPIDPAGGRLGEPVLSDAAGRFELQAAVGPRARGGDPLLLQAVHEGYCELRADLTRSGTDPGKPFELPLLRTATIEGRVLDGEGGAVAGADVASTSSRPSFSSTTPGAREKVEGEPEPSPLDALPDGWTLVQDWRGGHTTSAEGDYVLGGLLPWQTGSTLVAVADGFRSRRVAVDRTPGPGERLAIDLHLEREETGATVTGALSLNGRPAHGRVLWRQGSASGERIAVRSLRLEGLRPGPAVLEARPYELFHRGIEIPGLEGAVRTIDVPAEGEVQVDLDLRAPTRAIRGVLVDDADRPLAGASVRALLGGVKFAEFSPTDVDGRFVLDVPAGTGPYDLEAHRAGQRAEVQGVAAGAGDVTIVLARPGRLRLRARDAASGADITPVVAWRRDPDEPLRPAPRLGNPDPDGYRELEVPAGTVEVCVYDRARRHVPHVAMVRISSGATARIDVELERGLAVTLQFDPPLAEGAWFVPRDLLAAAGGAPGRLTRVAGFDDRFRVPAGPQARLEGLAPGVYVPLAGGPAPLDVVWSPAVVQVSVKDAGHRITWERRQ